MVNASNPAKGHRSLIPKTVPSLPQPFHQDLTRTSTTTTTHHDPKSPHTTTAQDYITLPRASIGTPLQDPTLEYPRQLYFPGLYAGRLIFLGNHGSAPTKLLLPFAAFGADPSDSRNTISLPHTLIQLLSRGHICALSYHSPNGPSKALLSYFVRLSDCTFTVIHRKAI